MDRVNLASDDRLHKDKRRMSELLRGIDGQAKEEKTMPEQPWQYCHPPKRYNDHCGGNYMSGTASRPRPPAYHRQRLLLFFLEFGGKGLGKLELQKLIFLYTMETQSRHYAFVPLPELGIEADKRRNLDSREAYDALLSDYRRDLPRRTGGPALLKQQIDDGKRLALTCFEEQPYLCHRHCIAELLEAEFGYRIEHI